MKISTVHGFSVILFVKDVILSCLSTSDLNIVRYFGLFSWKKCGIFWCCLVSKTRKYILIACL